MNILIINGSADLYGASRILVLIIEELSQDNNVYLLLPENGPMVDLLKDRNINVHIIFPGNMPVIARRFNSVSGLVMLSVNYIKSYFFIKKLVVKYKIDIGYANGAACLFVVKIFNQLKIRSVLHFHEILETPRKVVGVLNKWAVNWPDRIICVSNAVRDNLIPYIPNAANLVKLTVIHNGIEDIRKTVKKPTSNVIITLIGRITEAKGIWFFLNSVEKLEPLVAEQCLFRIVGGPAPGKEHLIEKLKADIAGHIYHDLLEYHEFVNDVSNYLNETDILVVPSLMSDPFPTTILEGLSAGKSVIASKSGGALESIEDEKSGFLVNRGDLSQFSNLLTTLINNEELRLNIGTAARKSFEEKYKVSTFKSKMKHYLTDFYHTR